MKSNFKCIVTNSIITAAVLAATLFSDSINAQQPRVAFAGGVTFSSYKLESNGASSTGDLKPGLTCGVLVDVPLGKNLFIQPAANWTQRGTLHKEKIGNSAYRLEIITNEVEMPVNLVYKFNGFFAGTGISLATVMEGHLRAKIDDEVTKKDMDFDNSKTANLRSFDIGANLVAGYELRSGLYVALNFTQGLRNLQPPNGDDAIVKCHYFGIRIGYLFKANK